MITEIQLHELRKAIYTNFPEIAQLEATSTIKCLDLPLRREYADQIYNGTKKVEFRWLIPFWEQKLINHDAEKFIDKNEKAIKQIIDQTIEKGGYTFDDVSNQQAWFIFPLVRKVETIHFHNYSPNGWRLDVEVLSNNFCEPDEDGKALLHSFGSYEQDEEWEEWERNKTPIDQREGFFYFVIGKILNAKNL